MVYSFYDMDRKAPILNFIALPNPAGILSFISNISEFGACVFQLKLFFSLLSKSDFFESGVTNSSDSNIDPRSLPHQRSRCHISKNMTPASHEKTQNQTK